MPSWTKEQNEAILSEGENIIVSAGAGSGKTAVLSERVINKLKNGVNIDELLILTFTKAAALEMKERIRKKIIKEGNLKDQLSRLDKSYITTFDAFALAIVKKYNYVLNVAKNISIIDESIINLTKKNILEDIFLKLYEVNDALFLNLIADFCVKDDEEIKEYILNIYEKLCMLADKETFLTSYEQTYYNDEFINKKIEDYEQLLGKKIAQINKLILDLGEYVDSDYLEKVNLNLGELLIADSYELIKDNLNSLPNLPRNSAEEAKEIKEKINAILKELDNLCVYEDKNELKESIYKTKDYVMTIIKIINLLDEKVLAYKHQHDLYEFSDIAKMAIQIVKENKNICEELKNSFQEILIDEYQDTNDLQELFISYISKNNVYMVGDIKQSIYRFRNANPYLFKSKYDAFSKNIGGKKIDLNKNFRSREEVLNDINLIFNNVMDDFYGGANYQESHQMCFGNTTYNEEGKLTQNNNLDILNYYYDKNSEFSKEEIEIFIIAQDIKKKIQNNYQVFDKDEKIIRNLTYEDIVILMDRSTNFNLYKKIFEFLNVPLNIYKDEDIKTSGDIALIKNILGLFLFKSTTTEFKYAYTSVARSFLFRLSDEEIFKTIMEQTYLTSPILEIIKNINYQELDIEELLLQIINDFKYYEKIITIGNITDHLTVIDYLVKQAEDLAKLGYTLKDFYLYLDNILKSDETITYPKIETGKGVKIMTIHKSKGLEYHLCYYSGLYHKFNLSDLKEKFLYDDKYGIITPYFNEGIRPIFYKELLKEKYLQEEISEKIRLFYVALTRAKEKMIMVAPFNIEKENDNLDKASFISFLDIMNAIKSKVNNFILPVSLDTLNLTKDYNLIKKSNFKENIKETNVDIKVDPINIVNEVITENHFSKNISKVLTKEEIKMMKMGTKIHQILANIDFRNPNLDNLNEFEKQKVLSLLNSKIFTNVQNIYQEYEFIDKDDTQEYHGIMDLVLEDSQEFKIIDYKLKNIQDEAYLKQLAGYKNYLQKKTTKPIRVYLYSILDEKLEELFIN